MFYTVLLCRVFFYLKYFYLLILEKYYDYFSINFFMCVYLIVIFVFTASCNNKNKQRFYSIPDLLPVVLFFNKSFHCNHTETFFKGH